jgi:hypothetical protein
MGAYVYVTKPSHVATAIVDIDGVESETEVALYHFAYKPFLSFRNERLNAEIAFRSGAVACIAAYARSDKAVPAYGVNFNEGKMQVYAAGRIDANGAFLTNGRPDVLDDAAIYRGRVVRWVRLPRGITEETFVITNETVF